MKKCALLFLAATLAVGAAGAPLKISVLDNSVLCVRASRLPADVTDQIRAAAVPGHLAGTVLDLRFADDAATNAADYFIHRKTPLVILVNNQTLGAAAALAAQLRASTSAVLIGNTNSPDNLSPDIVVAVAPDDEKKFQDNPFFTAPVPTASLTETNDLLAFVDHTSEADLVRKHIKDGEEDPGDVTASAAQVVPYSNGKDGQAPGEASSPSSRAEPPQPVIRDPALARAVDLLKALALLHRERGGA